MERTGHDRVDADLGPNASAKPAVSAFIPAFAAQYGIVSRFGRSAADAADVDDRAALAGGHPRPDERGQSKRPLEIDAQNLVPQLFGDARRVRVKRRDAGVVDEDVDASQLSVDSLDERVDVAPAPHVTGMAEAAPPEVDDLARDSVARVLLAARDHDVGSRPSEAERHRASEAARASRDERDASVRSKSSAADRGRGTRLFSGAADTWSSSRFIGQTRWRVADAFESALPGRLTQASGQV